MDPLLSLILCFLELTFIFITILILHSQQKNIGTTPLYMTMGLLFLFAQFVAAANFKVILFKNLEFQIGSSVLFMPYLGGLLLIYIHNGTLATQRMIIGSLVLFGVFLYLGEITLLQCNWAGFSPGKGNALVALDWLLTDSMRSMIALVLAHLADMFLIPILYTRLQNWGARRLICIIGALFIAQGLDLLIYSAVYYDMHYYEMGIFVSGAVLVRGTFSVWLGIMMYFYTKKRIVDAADHNTLDIVFAFFGAYGKSKHLEEVLSESEDRYRRILENANELIVILDSEGKVIDSNRAAAEMFEKYLPDYHSDDNLLEHINSDSIILPAAIDEDNIKNSNAPSLFHAELKGPDDKCASLACSISPGRLKNEKVYLLICRDVTKELELQQEKESLSEELAHSQRMEAIGKLAGGIAHDFNNHIHAILGHVDLLLMTNDFDDNPKAVKNLEKISSIAEQAGKLTSQLLGFARKGKFYATTLNMGDVVRHTLNILTVSQTVQIQIRTEISEEDLFVHGDKIQLSQVLLNLIINASDAMEKCQDKKIFIKLCRADEYCEKMDRFSAGNKLDWHDYCCVSVTDNGIGISEELQKKVFEPFFTTKPVGSGTGMGLSMVYGTICNHNGFVYLESSEGKGATFYVLLPITNKQ